MPRHSQRDALLRAALEALQERGCEGISVPDIVHGLGMTEAAFTQEVGSKEQLVVDLVEPLLNDIDGVLARFPRHPSWPGEGGRLLSDYLDVLIAHRDIVVWIDGDRALLGHQSVGTRLVESNRRVRAAIRGDDRSAAARLGASAALGAMWRPLRNMTDVEVAPEKEAILAAALAVVETLRS